VPEVIHQGEYVETEKVEGVPVAKAIQRKPGETITSLARAIGSVHAEETALMDPHFGNFLVDPTEKHYGGHKTLYFIDPEFSIPEASKEALEYDLKDVLSRIALTFRDENPVEKLGYFEQAYEPDIDVSQVLHDAAGDIRFEIEEEYRRQIASIADQYEN
jgi:hypothetical protein